jgi:cyclopropane fatty-acyl-phospholipid synthase-like methyltransferase
MKTLNIFLLLLIGSINALLAQHHHNSANEYMHKSSEEELIKRFDSEERDAYQLPDKVLKYIGKLKGKSIMDLGAGSGYFSIRLAKNGANVIAADVNEKFQAYLKERIAKEKITNIELRKIPYDNPMLDAKEVDLVLTVNTYHHIENRSVYFSKVKSGIKKGGELVIIDFFKTEIPVGPPVGHKVSIDEVIAELKEAGFKDFTIEVNLLPYQFIIKAK